MSQEMSQLSSRFQNLKIKDDEELLDCDHIMKLDDGPYILQNKLKSASLQQMLQTQIHYTFCKFGLLRYKTNTEKIKELKYSQLVDFDWFIQKEFFDFLQVEDMELMQNFLEQKYYDGEANYVAFQILKKVTQQIASNFVDPLLKFYQYICSIQIRQFREGAALMLAIIANSLNRLVEEHSSGEKQNFLAVKQCNQFLDKLLGQFVLPLTEDKGDRIRNYGLDILIDPLNFLSIILKESSYYKLFGQVLAKSHISHQYLVHRLNQVQEYGANCEDIIIQNKKKIPKGQVIRDNMTTLVNAQLDGLLNLFTSNLALQDKQTVQSMIKFGLANRRDQPQFDVRAVNKALKAIITCPDLNARILFGEILNLVNDKLDYSKQPYFQDIHKFVLFIEDIFERQMDYDNILQATSTVLFQMPSLFEPNCYLTILEDNMLTLQQQICLIYIAAAVLECEEVFYSIDQDFKIKYHEQSLAFKNIQERFTDKVFPTIQMFIDQRKLLQVTIPYLYFIKNVSTSSLKENSHLVQILFEKLDQQIELISIESTKTLCRILKRFMKEEAYRDICQEIINKFQRGLTDEEQIDEIRITTGGIELLKDDLICVIDLYNLRTIDLVISKFDQSHILRLFGQILINVVTLGYCADNEAIMDIYNISLIQRFLQIYHTSSEKILNESESLDIDLFINQLRVAQSYNLDLVQEIYPTFLYDDNFIDKIQKQLVKFLERHISKEITYQTILLLKELEQLLTLSNHLACSTLGQAAANYLINFIIVNKPTLTIERILGIIFLQAHQKFVDGKYNAASSFHFYIELINMIHKEQDNFIKIVVDYLSKSINISNNSRNDLIAEKIYDFLNEQLYEPRRQIKEDNLKFLLKVVQAPKFRTILLNYKNTHDVFDKILTDDTLNYGKISKAETGSKKNIHLYKLKVLLRDEILLNNNPGPNVTSQQYFQQKRVQHEDNSSDISSVKDTPVRNRRKTPVKKTTKRLSQKRQQNTQKREQVEEQIIQNVSEQGQSGNPTPQQKYKWGQEDQQESKIEKTQGKKFQKKQQFLSDDEDDVVGPKQRR